MSHTITQNSALFLAHNRALARRERARLDAQDELVSRLTSRLSQVRCEHMEALREVARLRAKLFAAKLLLATHRAGKTFSEK